MGQGQDLCRDLYFQSQHGPRLGRGRLSPWLDGGRLVDGSLLICSLFPRGPAVRITLLPPHQTLTWQGEGDRGVETRPTDQAVGPTQTTGLCVSFEGKVEWFGSGGFFPL